LSYFTELNRKPVPQNLFDFVTHTVCPIVHAADDISVMETLEALPSIFASARNMIGKTPYHLGPSSIGCRDNPYGASVASNTNNRRICLTDVDPRQRGIFAAAWNVGLAAAAARARVSSIALGAVTGSQGIIYRKLPFAQPGIDDTNALVYPAFLAFRALASSVGATSLAAISTAPGQVDGLAWRSGKKQFALVANLTGEEQAIKLKSTRPAKSVSMIDETRFTASLRDSSILDQPNKSGMKSGATQLKPYAVALFRW
jgi:D-apionolactonase